jgi:hypothetical protein
MNQLFPFALAARLTAAQITSFQRVIAGSRWA